MDFTNFSFSKNNNIKWRDSIGATIPFNYNGIEGELILKDFIDSDHLIIFYNNNEIICQRNSLVNGHIGNIINPGNRNYKYDINDVVETKLGKIKILEKFKKEGARWYKYKCLICGYEYEIRESQLLRGCGCRVCANNHIFIGINDFNTKYPYLANNIIDENDRHLKCSSTKKIKWKCPICENTIIDSICSVLNKGLHCSFCEKKYSFGENVLSNILSQLEIDFYPQKTFEWAKNKNGNHVFYDFYIESINCIIEVHGLQHYEETNFTRTLKKEQYNDKNKYLLAINNGIQNYITIDCRESSLHWIKNSILNNELFCKLFCTDKIIWNDVLDVHSLNIYNQVCELWNNGKSISEICNTLNHDRHDVNRLLRISIHNGHTKYTETEARSRGMKNKHSHKILKPIRCIDTGQVFSSMSLCEELSEQLFGVHITSSNIPRQINKNSRCNGLLFEYISHDEFNKIKEESPNSAFGDSFNLNSDGVVGPTTLSFLNTAIGKLSTTNSSSSVKIPYIVKITASELNIRSNAGMQYPIVGVIKDQGVYTITDENNGWGKLKSGAGWICLEYTKKL